MRKRLSIVPLVAVGLVLVGCSGKGRVTDHFYVQTPIDPANDSPWVVMLPGGSGLEVFGDSRVYFDAMDELVAAGHRACLIDYMAASDAAADPPDGTVGERTAWAVTRAVQWLQDTGQQDPDNARIMLLGWSLGAEGVWELTECPPDGFPARVIAATVFYPANREQRTLTRGEVPMLIQTGAADDLTPPGPIRDAVEDRPNTTLIVYEDAYHGFDSDRLPSKRRVFIPRIGIGPIVTFGYEPDAAKASHETLLAFLAENQ